MLFEQAAMTLVREMPVLAAARIIGVNNTRLWRWSNSIWPKPCPKWTWAGARPWLWTEPPPSGATAMPPSSST
ncbi:hypothetical protein DFAR_4040030 [Desulfarculales bacterium]